MEIRCLCFRKWHYRILLLMVILSPLFLFGNSTPAYSNEYLKIGVLGGPKNFNPFQTGDAWTKKVTGLIYQPLYMIDREKDILIPWLAENRPDFDSEEKTVTFRLREMKWDDGTEFTADDVVFTAQVIKKFKVPRYYAYWAFVDKIEAVDKRTVRLTLNRPMAVLYTRTLTARIVQKRKWEPIIRQASVWNEEETVSEKITREALKMLQGKMVKKPVGLGPFTLKSLKENTFIFLVRNEHFFGKGKIISGRELGPYIDGVIFKLYETLSNATLALKNRQIDFLWKGVSQAFVEDLIRDPNIIVPMTLDSGYRYLGFNLRRIPMSDPSFRRAVAYLIDKDFITKQILHDHGQRIDTFVPPLNTFYYNANTPVYGRGMDRKARTQKAYSILTAAGYIWKTPPLDANGSLEKGLGLTMPDGKPIPSLTLKTPSAEYDTEIAATGQLIQEWLRNFGIRVSWETMAFDGLVQKVKNSRDFDMFLMGWRNLSFDPDYLRRFFHSSYDRPNEWNYTGYINAEFDLMADLQAKMLVPEERKKIVMRLQAQLMDDLPYVPLYVPHRMEGVRIDRLSGWVSQVGGVGNIWSFCLLRPGGN